MHADMQRASDGAMIYLRAIVVFDP